VTGPLEEGRTGLGARPDVKDAPGTLPATERQLLGNSGSGWGMGCCRCSISMRLGFPSGLILVGCMNVNRAPTRIFSIFVVKSMSVFCDGVFQLLLTIHLPTNNNSLPYNNTSLHDAPFSTATY
jgi:hypothetical protein